MQKRNYGPQNRSFSNLVDELPQFWLVAYYNRGLWNVPLFSMGIGMRSAKSSTIQYHGMRTAVFVIHDCLNWDFNPDWEYSNPIPNPIELLSFIHIPWYRIVEAIIRNVTCKLQLILHKSSTDRALLTEWYKVQRNATFCLFLWLEWAVGK